MRNWKEEIRDALAVVPSESLPEEVEKALREVVDFFNETSELGFHLRLSRFEGVKIRPETTCFGVPTPEKVVSFGVMAWGGDRVVPVSGFDLFARARPRRGNSIPARPDVEPSPERVPRPLNR